VALTIREVLARSAEFLERKGVENPRLDSERLLAHALGISRVELYTGFERPLTEAEAASARELVERRGRREPLAYVLGEWDFRRLTLATDERALVPRPETEQLVERCLELLRDWEEPEVLDVGTGTGAIALALADEKPAARVTAVDVSRRALSLAAENVERTGLPVLLREGGLDVAMEGWDLVVSNPPYVGGDEIGGLQPEVRDFEPREALVGDDFHVRLAELAQTSWLVLEVGDGQAAGVAATLERLGYQAVRVTDDLAGTPRIVEGWRGA
jgi:release factor glutamine methyltransferase